MSRVRIRYVDVPYKGKEVRLIRFDNEPRRSPSFFSGFGGHSDEVILEEDPNSHLAAVIEHEVTELFKADKLSLYFDSTELVFHNEDEALQGFSSTDYDDRDFEWREVTLKTQYE